MRVWHPCKVCPSCPCSSIKAELSTLNVRLLADKRNQAARRLAKRLSENPCCLAGLEGLTTLNMHGCEMITSQGILSICGLSNLQHLNLELCNRASGLEHMAGKHQQLHSFGVRITIRLCDSNGFNVIHMSLWLRHKVNIHQPAPDPMLHAQAKCFCRVGSAAATQPGVVYQHRG